MKEAKQTLSKEERMAKLAAKQEMFAPKKKASPVSAGYDPKPVESKWTAYWREKQSFLPKENKEKFSICIPPPNITGSLHIGHSMMISIEDAIVRYKRINNNEVLYLPGLDHAGIATQTVVLKNIAKTSQNKEVTREFFTEEAFKWSNKYSNRILEQIDRMGTSVDYSRKAFTLDPSLCRAVTTAFCKLYNKGLIYRDNKIVNWCSKLKTTLSDLEVDFKDIKGGSYLEIDGGRYKFGIMYYIKYYLTRSPENTDIENLPYVIVGTTRPETILGDTAICINSNDQRFSDLDKIFSTCQFPDPFNESNINIKKLSIEENSEKDIEEGFQLNEELKNERKNKYKMNNINVGESKIMENLYAINPLTKKAIPVICDDLADLNFGTGILKITPCHDPNDFKVGKKMNLEFIKIFDENNFVTASDSCGIRSKGLKRFEARLKIVKYLREKGILVKEDDHDQVMPICNRSGDIIEPLIKEQWWMNSKDMANRAAESVKSGEIKLYPEEAKSIWYRWLYNHKDWCLSRQLWWGHRIPAYKIVGTEEWVVAESEEEAYKIANSKGYDKIIQDEDVLDTWFSSALWPFSTMGWPDKTEDMKRYFPNSLLETGSDILFFWVARMVMMSYELLDSKPFDSILLHGIVRDAHGRKMSKSLGNVIDPLYVIDGISLEEMIENLQAGNLDPREFKRASDALKKDYPNGISKCGADALRFALLSYTNGMKDINLDIKRVQGYSRLCNKIWNATNFVIKAVNKAFTGKCVESSGMEVLNESFILDEDLNVLEVEGELREHHKWILQNLNNTIAEQHRYIENYNFMMATQSIHKLFLYDFCDIYIEISKDADKKDAVVLKYVFVSILKLLNPFMPFITEEMYSKFFKNVIEEYPVVVPMELENSFNDIIELSKICRSNGKVKVVESEGVSYLKSLTKNSCEFVNCLDDFEVIGGFKYQVTQ